MNTPIVQVLLQGRVLQSVRFRGERMRIGRMKENDIVIDNLSVSRFHAALAREGERVVLEDSGSENGCYVNGKRVEGWAVIEPGDEIRIGKHLLVLRASDAAGDAATPAPGRRSDPWDAAKTYLVGPDTMARMFGEKPAAGTPAPGADLPPASAARAAEAPPVQSPDPAEDSVLDLGAPLDPALCDELGPPLAGAAADSVPPVGGSAADPEGATSPPDVEDVSLFDFAPDADLALSGAEWGGFGRAGTHRHAPASPDARASERGAPPTLYPGLIVQRQGRLERVLSWDRNSLRVGRDPGCEVRLDGAGVSRQHALLEREGEHFEVRDLDSVQGVLVHGERVKRHRLAVGDVIRIDEFELTFLLDRSPIGSEIRTEEARANATALDADARLDPVRGDATVTRPRPDAGRVEAAASADTVLAAEEPDGSLFSAFDVVVEEEKELAEAEEAAGIGREPCAGPTASASRGEPRIELVLGVAVEDLPAPLRDALAALGSSGQEALRLPVEIRLRRQADD